MIDFAATFISFFAVIDPIGTVPVFIAFTSHYDQKTKRKVALRATVASTVILVFFLVAGEVILAVMSIPLSAFQVAGGIIVFLFAYSMIFGESKPDEELQMVEDDHQQTAIYPLAVPSIASPGAILVAVLLTENARFNFWEQVQTAAVMILVLLVTYILMLASGFIDRLIGTSGASVISRVMGLILSAVAATNLLEGIKSYFEL